VAKRKKPQKNPAAQALVKKRWEKLTPKERSEIARGLARKRWAKR
jgi:hypothetical protein